MRFPQPTTEAARRFWVRKLTLKERMRQRGVQQMIWGVVIHELVPSQQVGR